MSKMLKTNWGVGLIWLYSSCRTRLKDRSTEKMKDKLSECKKWCKKCNESSKINLSNSEETVNNKNTTDKCAPLLNNKLRMQTDQLSICLQSGVLQSWAVKYQSVFPTPPLQTGLPTNEIKTENLLLRCHEFHRFLNSMGISRTKINRDSKMKQVLLTDYLQCNKPCSNLKTQPKLLKYQLLKAFFHLCHKHQPIIQVLFLQFPHQIWT